MLVRVRANGVCATDLKIVDGLVPSVSLPHVLGHEAAGEVADVGQTLMASGPAITLLCIRPWLVADRRDRQ